MSPALADLDAELSSHREALEAFSASIESLDHTVLNSQPAAGKWSPAQVAEHLRLTYVTLSEELEGQGGFRVRTKWWQQRLLRFRYLQQILGQGRFPKGVPATREIRPGDGPFERTAVIATLRAEAVRFLRLVPVVAQQAGVGVTHPFLGKVGLLQGIRFKTQHIRHHHQQVLPQRA
jgi:hypothetical protein